VTAFTVAAMATAALALILSLIGLFSLIRGSWDSMNQSGRPEEGLQLPVESAGGLDDAKPRTKLATCAYSDRSHADRRH
jgi:hypothetical protein